MDLFNKKSTGTTTAASQKPSSDNWYVDRYQQLIVQRNLFFVLASLSLIFLSVSVAVIGWVVSNKKVEPMVVEVDELSGITTLVNPNKDKSWQVSDAINSYFLITYLRARETYNAASYLYNYNTVVRLLSSYNVYSAFKKSINDPAKSPVLKYGSSDSTRLEVRSILPLKSSTSSGQNAQVRFTIVEEQGNKKVNKIASIIWDYVEMDLGFEDKAVNPLGFQVQFYNAVDDVNP